MFSIEHDFDATVITLIDEGEATLGEDVTITAFAECVVIEQLDARTDTVQRITLSMTQLADLAPALDLPGDPRREGEEVARRAVIHPLVDVAAEVIDGGDAAADVADRQAVQIDEGMHREGVVAILLARDEAVLQP